MGSRKAQRAYRIQLLPFLEAPSLLSVAFQLLLPLDAAHTRVRRANSRCATAGGALKAKSMGAYRALVMLEVASAPSEEMVTPVVRAATEVGRVGREALLSAEVDEAVREGRMAVGTQRLFDGDRCEREPTGWVAATETRLCYVRGVDGVFHMGQEAIGTDSVVAVAGEASLHRLVV